MRKLVKGLLVVGGFIALSLQANATGLKASNSDKVMTSSEFYNTVAHTKTQEIAANFGFPDKMFTLKNPSGVTEGVIWVYSSAVKCADGFKDARIVLINGEMKYVAITDAV